MPNPLPGALFSLRGPGGSTHHVLCLKVPLQLLPEVVCAEFHRSSPAGTETHLGPATVPSALSGATSAKTPTSALTRASLNAGLLPSDEPDTPTVKDFRAYHLLANQSLRDDRPCPSARSLVGSSSLHRGLRFVDGCWHQAPARRPCTNPYCWRAQRRLAIADTSILQS